ncbi:SRPBCC family protein [Elioraea rosea]|uniref:SRPBCC family protein n=1 Tax=Elioraea rosea TaxID=2492390 RepID=UPI00118251A1|nr:SRPBCC family protein [Elioraea rosea]
MEAPVAKAGMLIRRPVAEVFEAFVDPAVTTRFWFTEATGRVEPGARLRWSWAMYGVATDLEVKAIDDGRRIAIAWDLADDPTEVEWLFSPRADHTFVEVVNRGFGAGRGAVERALDAAGGFALVLAAAKIWLEHGVDPRFVADRHPDAHVRGWQEP